MDESICCKLSSLEAIFLSFLGREGERELRGKDDTFHLSLSLDVFTALTGPLLLHYCSVILPATGKHLITSAQFSGFPLCKRKFVSLGQSSAIALWQKSSVYVLLTKAYVHLLYHHCLLGKTSLKGSCEFFHFGLPEKLFPTFFKRISVSWRPKFCLCPKAESYPQCHQRWKGANSIKSKHLTVFNEISPWEKYEITLLLFLFQEPWVIVNCFRHKIMAKQLWKLMVTVLAVTRLATGSCKRGFCKKCSVNLTSDAREPTATSALPAGSRFQQKRVLPYERIFLGRGWAMGVASSKGFYKTLRSQQGGTLGEPRPIFPSALWR